jgi:murein L,D-transpeptidase YcbB/YkuD
MAVRSSPLLHRRAVLAGSAALASSALAARADARGGATLSQGQVETLSKALAEAPSHGFRKAEFTSSDLADSTKSGDLQTPAGQARLKAAILAYARAQRGGRLAASQFLEEWSVRPAPYDPTSEFNAAVASDRLQAWLDSLPPRYQGYQALRKSLAAYRAIASKGGWGTVPGSDTPFTVGASDARVPALRKRLMAEDGAVQTDVDQPEVFDPALQQAVQRFQQRYGLRADGVIGAPTMEALNVPVGGRILQIEANMERWRWLPRELPATRVQVNIAAAVLAVYREGEPVMAMKAVAGRPEDQTPMLKSDISSIVLNPPWHVPDSIAKKEIWPKAHKDHAYLARNQYQVIGGRLVQRAGPKSALGRFKFDFPNSFGVYLHDTPAQAGFGRASRLASHGCVRLEQPKALATLLLDDNANWPGSRIDTVIQGDDTIRVPLSQTIPVYILYWTVFVDNSGQTQFRSDAYDWDQKLMDLLNGAKTHDSDSVNLTT